MSDFHDLKINILVIGDAGVGKTSLCKTISDIKENIDKSYLEHIEPISTIGVELHSYITKWPNEKTVKLLMWDTAGQERFASITQSYYRKGAACILVYDLQKEYSYKSLYKHIRNIKHMCIPNIPVIIIGNKHDSLNSFSDFKVLNQKKKANINNGLKIAENNDFPFFTTSIYDSTKLNKAFDAMSDIIYQFNESNQYENYPRVIKKNYDMDLDVIKLNDDENKSYTKCGKCNI